MLDDSCCRCTPAPHLQLSSIWGDLTPHGPNRRRERRWRSELLCQGQTGPRRGRREWRERWCGRSLVVQMPLPRVAGFLRDLIERRVSHLRGTRQHGRWWRGGLGAPHSGPRRGSGTRRVSRGEPRLSRRRAQWPSTFAECGDLPVGVRPPRFRGQKTPRRFPVLSNPRGHCVWPGPAPDDNP